MWCSWRCVCSVRDLYVALLSTRPTGPGSRFGGGARRLGRKVRVGRKVWTRGARGTRGVQAKILQARVKIL